MTIKEQSQARLYTADDLLNMPDDGKRYELHNGELIAMNPPSYNHAKLSGELFGLLWTYTKAHDLGVVTGSDGGYLLHTDPATGRQTIFVPDVAFHRKDRKPADGSTLYHGAPDLAIEIISPSETYTMIREKLAAYFTYGTGRVWLVYPIPRKVEIYNNPDETTVLDSDATLDAGEVLPGFALKLADLFAVLD